MSATKFLCVKTVNDKIVRRWPYSWPINPCENDCWGRLLLRENLAKGYPPLCKTPIFNLYSLVTPSEKN